MQNTLKMCSNTLATTLAMF